MALPVAEKVGLGLFELPVGRRFGLRLSGVTIPLSAVSVRTPTSALISTADVWGSDFLEGPVTQSDTYTVLVDPYGNGTGAVTLTLYDVADVTAATILGAGPVAFALQTPGQNGRLTFAGTAGQRVSVSLTGITVPESYVSVLRPSGSPFAAPAWTASWTTPFTGFVDTLVLQETGIHTVLFDAYRLNIGGVTMTVREVPPDVAAQITPGGAPVMVSLTTPGQDAKLSFTGTAGQRISVRLSGNTISQSYVSLVKPDGSNLVAPIWTTGTSAFLDTVTLPVSGVYGIAIDPYLGSTGSVTVTAYDVPADVAIPATFGSGAGVSLATPGQNGVVTFTGTAGQRVFVSVSSNTVALLFISVRRPAGTNLVAPTLVTSSTGFIDAVLLDASGTFAVVTDAFSESTGSLTVTVYDVPPEATASTTVGAAAVAVPIGTPGQNGIVTFPCTTGQAVTVRASGNTLGLATVSLLNPSSTSVASMFGSGSLDLPGHTCAATGTYTIRVDPYGAGTGTLSVEITTP
jgi:hypothetical protein